MICIILHTYTYLKIQHDPWKTENNFEGQNTLNWSFKKEFKNFCSYIKEIILPYKLNNTNFPPKNNSKNVWRNTLWNTKVNQL